METPQGHPTRDELLAMAYADGELTPEAHEQFRVRMQHEPKLAKAVSDHQRLALVARQLAPPEPMDYEWQRIAEEGHSRAWAGLAWALMFVGGLGLAGWAVLEVYRSELDPLAKTLSGALLVGILLLFLYTLRNRLRTLPFDPYTEVQR
jgi:anti-sigma factor RsiW